MKKAVILISLVFSLGFATKTNAQYDVDALRFSYLTFGGTARSMAVGGAFGAPGADFSALSTNPAGIGLYKSSEIMFTPSLYISTVESNFYEEANPGISDIKYAFNFTNLGLVMAFEPKPNNESSWKNLQFAFGFNKIRDFHQRTEIEGFNPQSSLMTVYRDKANALGDLSYYDTELAFNTNLLWYDSLDNQFHVDAPYGGVNQRKSIEEWGAINEATLSFGGNYNDKIYAGVTIGIPILNYHMDSRYTEIDTKDSINMFKSLTLDEELHTTGAGVNFKLGLLFRPAEWIRFGGALHTPTFYTLHEEYSRHMASRFENSAYNAQEPAAGEFDYELTTPLRAFGDVAFFIGKRGMITAQYEYVDYANARLSEETGLPSESQYYDFKDDNEAITAKYTSTHNIKVGGELNLAPLQLRAGYALYSSPYANNINDGERTYYTFGIGFKEKNYYIDVAYIIENYQEDYYLYDPRYINPSKNEYNSNRLALTFGVKW